MVVDKVICGRCRKIIPNGEDKLEYEGKIFCPHCYVKVIKTKPSAGEKVWICLGISLLILTILSWILYFAWG